MNNRFFAVLVLALIHACASYQATTAPSLAFDYGARQEKVEADGVMLMAKAMHRESDLRQYFDDDPLKYGILPVQIHVENQSNEPYVYCTCDGFNLVDADGNRMTTLTVDQVMDEIKRSHWRTAGWTVGFGVFGLIPSAINVNKVNKKMRADLETKIYTGGQLPSGHAEEGFVFFAVPETMESIEGWKLAAVVVGTEYELTLEVPFHGTVARRVNPDDLADDEEDYG